MPSIPSPTAPRHHRRSFSDDHIEFAPGSSSLRRTPTTQAKFHIFDNDSSDDECPSQKPRTVDGNPPASPPSKSAMKSKSTSSIHPTPSFHENRDVHVHFPRKLEKVTLFKRAARPSSLFSPTALETESETETPSESEPFFFPHPSFHHRSGHILLQTTGPLPISNPDMSSNVFLESLSLSSTLSSQQGQISVPANTTSLFLHGSVVLRNLAYEKRVFIRFTVDDWDTTSEVAAKYQCSLPSPPLFLVPKASGSFDRFVFCICLSHHLSGRDQIPLLQRKLSLAVRYQVPGKGEWWDNHQGENWNVRFKGIQSVRERSSSAPASITVPITSSVPQQQPPPPGVVSEAEQPLSDPARHRALEEMTRSVLTKLHLTNYSAPRTPSAENTPIATPVPRKKMKDDVGASWTAESLTPPLRTTSPIETEPPILRPRLSFSSDEGSSTGPTTPTGTPHLTSESPVSAKYNDDFGLVSFES